MVKTRAAAVDLYGGKGPARHPRLFFPGGGAEHPCADVDGARLCVGQSNFKSLLHLPAESAETHALSFFNLVEMQVIAELRRDYHVSMGRVRAALQFLADHVPVRHPLVEKELSVTPNQRVYIVHEGRYIDISSGGQWPLDAVVRNLLRRVTRGRKGILSFFPRVAVPKQVAIDADDYAPIVVDPEICFGRPVVAGTGIPTDVIADRRRGGDSVKEIAEDYDLAEDKIAAALTFERVLEADAA